MLPVSRAVQLIDFKLNLDLLVRTITRKENLEKSIFLSYASALCVSLFYKMGGFRSWFVHCLRGQNKLCF